MRPPGDTFSQRERHSLCDLLLELGPDVPTLCEGWRSADLAAHLLIRDRRPDTMPGAVVALRPLKAWTERVQQSVRDTLTWDVLVERVRNGPPPLTRPFDQAANTVEYFVHHEDLRRAQPGWEPRELAPADEDALWRRLNGLRFIEMGMGLLPGHHAPAGCLEAPGRPAIKLARAGTGPVARGPVGELVMWALGRKDAARVELED